MTDQDTTAAADTIAADAKPAADNAAPDTTADDKAPVDGDKGKAAAPVDEGTKPPADPIAKGGDDGKEAAPAADWPADWRQKLAGDDKKRMATLERFASPQALADAYDAAQKKISELGARPAIAKPGKDATPEQIAEYRKAMGVPEKPDGYKLELPDGRQLGDDDKPVMNSFTAAMHEAGAPPEVVNRAAAWYFDMLEEQHVAQRDADEAYKASALKELKEEWGADFRRNVNSIATLFEGAPDGVFDRLLGGRTADGRLIGDDPQVMRLLTRLALDLNPAATLIPSGQGSPASMDARIAEIEEAMKKDGGRAYWHNDAMQKEYGELLAARDKLRSRQAA